MDLFIAISMSIFFLIFGNYLADSATLRDCATKGEAKMLSGGTIKCEAKKEGPTP